MNYTFENDGSACPIGYIYALYYNDTPFYIGQSVVPHNRLRQHHGLAFRWTKKEKSHTYLTIFIQYMTTSDNFYRDITMRILKICPTNCLLAEEFKYIKHCVDRKNILVNNCTHTIEYQEKLFNTSSVNEYNKLVVNNLICKDKIYDKMQIFLSINNHIQFDREYYEVIKGCITVRTEKK